MLPASLPRSSEAGVLTALLTSTLSAMSGGPRSPLARSKNLLNARGPRFLLPNRTRTFGGALPCPSLHLVADLKLSWHLPSSCVWPAGSTEDSYQVSLWLPSQNCPRKAALLGTHSRVLQALPPAGGRSQGAAPRGPQAWPMARVSGPLHAGTRLLSLTSPAPVTVLTERRVLL